MNNNNNDNNIDNNSELLIEAYTPCGQFLFEIDNIELTNQQLYLVGQINIITAKNIREPIQIQLVYTRFFDKEKTLPRAECVMSFDGVVLSRTEDRNRFGFSYEKTNTWAWNQLIEKAA